jgi:ATP-binding cassette subfamily B protein
VSFRYPSGVRDAVSSVDLEVRTGEMIALVGANGSGKTTMAKLLAGLLPPTAGEIVVDGAPIRGREVQWRHRVAVMFQDFSQYLVTFRQQVGFGRVECLDDEARIVRAADMAGLGGVVTSLPNGLDTLLGPEFIGGTDLSGGQWQRLALARAFFRDASVLILDEPSAALDPDAEAELFATVKQLCQGRAVVVVSHRFSTVLAADRIYVMADGGVVENGSHSDLMRSNGTYARLFRLQADRYASGASEADEDSAAPSLD